MAEEERGKRRGRRKRGRADAHRRPIEPREEAPQAEEPEALVIEEESDVPGVTGSRRRFRFGRGSKETADGSRERPRSGERRGAGAASEGSVSPMDFWRSGSARSHRPAPERVTTGPRWMRRITNFYLPPWAPVVGIIFVVFGILGFLFIVRSATGAPRIGDHWHIPYQFFACGEKQPNAPVWETGVHTHADGIIHIHPFQTFEEGSGARLVKWFEYGGGKLTNTEVRIPGSSKAYKNGDTCSDGRPGEVQVFVTRVGATTEERLRGNDLTRFIPHDGDRVRIVFGPPEEIIQAEDRTVIPEEQASRTIEITVTDDGSEAGTRFDPVSVEVSQGEIVKLVIKNTGTISHGFRVSGADGVYENGDDFVVTPDGEDAKVTAGILQPGAQGSVIVRLDIVSEVEFRDDTLQDKTGAIVVRKSEDATPSPTPVDEERVDTEFELTMTDNVFSQTEFTVKAGDKFRFNLTNAGPTFVHNLRVAGPDGEFDTDDDLVSDPQSQRVGVPGELVGQIDKKGTYAFRDDFHPTEMTGTLVVE